MRHTIENLATLQARIQLRNEKRKPDIFFDYGKIEDKTIKKGLDYIKSDYKQNYTDLKHIMYLGKLEGFQNQSTVHISDIFPRSLVNDCLFHVASRHKIDIDGFLEQECQYLLEHRNKDEVGGWSYFPTVREIAADIDDLGQIIQLLVNCKKTDWVESHCLKAISTVLEERALADGSFETWIIPKKKSNRYTEKTGDFQCYKVGKRARCRSGS